MDPVAPYETTLATVAAGRAGTVAQLRSLADRLEHLALTDVAEALRRQAELALARRPAPSLVKRIE